MKATLNSLDIAYTQYQNFAIRYVLISNFQIMHVYVTCTDVSSTG
jgi:hypothetical protein